MAAGRPRTFDCETALDRAMMVFWKHGYEGATIPELTEAMGINRPSMYAAFGNKEELYRKALARYAAGPAAFFQDAISAPTTRQVAAKLLAGSIEMVCDPKKPGGCFAIQGALACSKEHQEINQTTAAFRSAGENALRTRFEQAKKDGDLPAEIDPADLAKYLTAVQNGLAIQAASGATKQQLERVAALVMKMWPT